MKRFLGINVYRATAIHIERLVHDTQYDSILHFDAYDAQVRECLQFAIGTHPPKRLVVWNGSNEVMGIKQQFFVSSTRSMPKPLAHADVVGEWVTAGSVDDVLAFLLAAVRML